MKAPTTSHPPSGHLLTLTQRAKMGVDPKFIELAADVFIIFFNNESRHHRSEPQP